MDSAWPTLRHATHGSAPNEISAGRLSGDQLRSHPKTTPCDKSNHADQDMEPPSLGTDFFYMDSVSQNLIPTLPDILNNCLNISL